MELTQVEGPDGGVDAAMARLAYRRRLLDWRDRWSVEAEVRLREACGAMEPLIEEHVAAVSYWTLAVGHDAFVDGTILPLLGDRIGPEVDALLAEAEAALGQLRKERFAATIGRAPRSTASAADLRHAIGPTLLVAGAGALAITPALAVSSTSILLGFATVTTVSMPLLVAGVGAAALLGATGVVKTYDIPEQRRATLRRHIADTIEARVLATGAGADSIASRLRRGFAEQAEQMLEAA